MRILPKTLKSSPILEKRQPNCLKHLHRSQINEKNADFTQKWGSSVRVYLDWRRCFSHRSERNK